MGVAQISFWVFVAVLVFWAVGAYNRLVRLRAAIKQAFTATESQIRQRDALLAQWAEASRAQAQATGESHAADAVLAACAQVLAASDHARAWPSGARAIAGLRLAEEVLGDARARLNTELAAMAPMVPMSPMSLTRPVIAPTPQAEALAAVDASLGFARHQYNDAAQTYNDAVAQFPTWVIAGVFGFRAAGAL